MSTGFTRFRNCGIFELITENDVRFSVHKDVLVSQSKPFREATSGVWTEASERQINLQDWDGDTVGRMVQYLYTGDYDYPDPIPLVSPPSTVASTPELSIIPNDDFPPDINRPLTPLNDCVKKFLPIGTDCPVSDNSRVESFDPTEYDYKNALLSHAKVYALANYKSIAPLRALALERLLMTLNKLNPIEPNSHVAVNIVDLAGYVYANTDHLSNSEEPLQKLISQFVALNFRELQTEPKMVDLIGSGGDFVKDVVAKVCRRLPPNRKIRFVSRLRVVYGNGGSPPPPEPDSIQDLDGGSGNINNYNPVWLVPEYTTNPAEACTSFSVSNSASSCSQPENLAWGRSLYRYLEASQGQNVAEKITEVALKRKIQNKWSLSGIGYHGMSANIKQGWGDGDYLYLVWKTVKTSIV